MATTETPLIPQHNRWLILALILVAGWLIYLLSGVLMPFFIAALLAYLGDPLVDRLEDKKLSRTLSVSIVFVSLFITLIVALLLFIPLLNEQLKALFEKLPGYIDRLQTALSPVMQSLGLSQEVFDLETVKTAFKDYWAQAGKVAGNIVGYVSKSGLAVMTFLTNLVLIPVLTFYLLRDWDILVGRIKELLPRRYQEEVSYLAKDCDDMLAGFLRGQLMVMLALAIIYSIGLTLIGLDLALLIGVIAGIVSFVPYLGLLVGILLAGTAAYLQFQEWLPVLFVIGVFSFAQLIEGMFLTPRFVGERIGMHPVAVIFAVMAGGSLFGFIGVLLALPVAAVIMVMLRHAHDRYVKSQLYS
ncbi:Putative permease often clustered with de novo purine synthesis [Methylophaga frappieri]|uniref:Putative permease often clustered with de novo purine synthesis n=1 Tax=Methylophaga frappieri (strain ATCC BAA-2434 / DSM 25690 / JAM7) TaxID=754477 RepID=I1YLG6_METFJ|nr:AI-2E family transporter [Methylophaga frappieri]AFJ03759.1 Putative permease often clustered with de novo purine synthesis [Methylophaga frappieri]